MMAMKLKWFYPELKVTSEVKEGATTQVDEKVKEEVATQVDEKVKEEVATQVDEKGKEEVGTQVGGKKVKEATQTAEEMQRDEGELADQSDEEEMDEDERECMHVYF